MSGGKWVTTCRAASALRTGSAARSLDSLNSFLSTKYHTSRGSVKITRNQSPPSAPSYNIYRITTLQASFVTIHAPYDPWCSKGAPGDRILPLSLRYGSVSYCSSPCLLLYPLSHLDPEVVHTLTAPAFITIKGNRYCFLFQFLSSFCCHQSCHCYLRFGKCENTSSVTNDMMLG